MKKSFSIVFASALALSTVFVGCKKTIEEDPDAGIYIEGNRINFTAQVLSGENQTKSTAGLEGASIMLSGAGETQTVTADAAGNAHFANLEEGTYSINISLADYSSLSATIRLDDNGTGNDANASAQFTLFNMSASAEGVVYLNSNNTNDTTCVVGPVFSSNAESCDPDYGANLTITAVCQIEWGGAYDVRDWNQGNGNVTIQDLTYEGLNVQATTGTDGSWSMNLASTAAGLPYRIYYPSVAVDQIIEDPTDATKTVLKRKSWGDSQTGVFDAITGVTYIDDKEYN